MECKKKGVKSAPKGYNILLITTDTQRTDTLSCMGSPFAHSPCLDRLAAEGVLFERAYTAAPACMPARCSILTGLHAPLHGCVENGVKRYDGLPVFMDALKELGYRNMMFGKTHFGPIPASFDIAETINGEKGQSRQDFYSRYFAESGYPEASGFPNSTPEAHCLDSLIVDRTIHHIREAEKTKTPFFAFCSLPSPHSPLDPPPEWEDCYRTQDIPAPHCTKEEWKTLPPSLQELCNLGKKGKTGDWIADLVEGEGNVAENTDIESVKRYKALYYADAAYCDALVGRLLAFLDESGLRKSTLVIFTSDHGQQYFDHGFNDKHNFYEETCRIPLIFSLPGVLPQKKRCSFASTVDLAPSIVGAAGGCYREANGFDLFTPLVHNENMPRTCAVSYIQHSMALITERFSLEYYLDDRCLRLFDRQNDPVQDKNLAQEPRWKQLSHELLEALLLWYLELTDIKELQARLSSGGPVAARAVRRLRKVEGNDGDRNLGDAVNRIMVESAIR